MWVMGSRDTCDTVRDTMTPRVTRSAWRVTTTVWRKLPSHRQCSVQFQVHQNHRKLWSNREKRPHHIINKVESQSQSKTVILCPDPSGRTCLWKQSRMEQRILSRKSSFNLLNFSFLLISNLCLLSPKMSTSLPTQDMNLPITPALHRLDPDILSLEVGGHQKAGDTFDQPQTRQKRKIRVRTKIPLSSEVVR